MTVANVYAIAIDPVACRVLLNTGELGVVADYADDDLLPIEPDMADVVIYRDPFGNCRASDLDLLAWFTVH